MQAESGSLWSGTASHGKECFTGTELDDRRPKCTELGKMVNTLCFGYEHTDLQNCIAATQYIYLALFSIYQCVLGTTDSVSE
jgi:hypothetical protein